MADDNNNGTITASTSDAGITKLAPRNKIVIPEAFTKADTNGCSSSSSSTVAPVSDINLGNGQTPAAPVDMTAAVVETSTAAVAADVAAAAAAAAAEATTTPAKEEAVVAAVSPPTPMAEQLPKPTFSPISPGLCTVKLPLGLASKEASNESAPPVEDKAKEEPPTEAKIGDLVELFMGRGQVRGIREEDGMLEVWAMGWEMAGEQRPRFFVQRSAVKVVPTVYYKMPVLERLQIAAWLKGEGGKLFKAGDFEQAAERYMKSIGVLKTCEFKTNAQNARALEVMIPCHNNAATCKIKSKNYGDARLLAENVDTLCSALERNRTGMVMKALKERGVGETTVFGQWWCKGLFLGGKACLYQGENQEAVDSLKKGSKLAKPAALAKLRTEINNELEKATKRLASQTKKAQKMWTKAFSKNSTDPPEAHPKEARTPAAAAPTPAAAAANGINGAPQMSVLERLEALSKMGGVSATPKSAAKEDEEEESDDEEEEEYDDDDEEEEEGQSLASSGLFWGSLAVGAVAVSAAALVALGKRR